MPAASPATLLAAASDLEAAVVRVPDYDLDDQAYWDRIEALEEAVDTIDEAARIEEWGTFVSVTIHGLRWSGDTLVDACANWCREARRIAARGEAA